MVQLLKTFFVVDSEKRLPSDSLESRDSVKYVMFGMFLPRITMLAWKSNRKSHVNCQLALYLPSILYPFGDLFTYLQKFTRVTIHIT